MLKTIKNGLPQIELCKGIYQKHELVMNEGRSWLVHGLVKSIGKYIKWGKKMVHCDTLVHLVL